MMFHVKPIICFGYIFFEIKIFESLLMHENVPRETFGFLLYLEMLIIVYIISLCII